MSVAHHMNRLHQDLISADEMFGMSVHTPIHETIGTAEDADFDELALGVESDDQAQRSEEAKLARDGFLRVA